MSDDNADHAAAAPATDTGRELRRLRTRIDQQSQQLNRHARELTALHKDLAELDQRIDAHQHGDYHPGDHQRRGGQSDGVTRSAGRGTTG